MTLVFVWAVWLVINLITFILYGVDKCRARRGKWRIPEKTLLSGTWLLGGVGAWLAMRAFRHKTKHPKFTIGIPVILALQLIAVAYFLSK